MIETDDSIYFENDEELNEYETKELLYKLRFVTLPLSFVGILFIIIYLTSSFN